MATIIDVAKRAGVSIATVSRVVSTPDMVRPKTRQRVDQAIAELGYSPNSAAKSLRTLRTSRLLVTVPAIANPFYSDVISGAEKAARDAGYSLVLATMAGDPMLEDAFAEMYLRREVDGILFLSNHVPQNVLDSPRLAGRMAPLVSGGEHLAGDLVPSVCIDNDSAGFEATEYLLRLGHRRIGIIAGHAESSAATVRMGGARRAIKQNAEHPKLIERQGDFSLQSGYDQAAALVAQKVTAIFCANDEMAIGALHAIRDLGLECPHDISVMGFDDIAISRHVAPTLTTIAMPKFDMGRQSVEILLKIIGGEVVPIEPTVLPHQLIVRDSTGPARERTKK